MKKKQSMGDAMKGDGIVRKQWLVVVEDNGDGAGEREMYIV